MGDIEKLTIKEGDRERTIYIPIGDDMSRSRLDEIKEWQTEKTKKELRQPRERRKHSKEETGQALRDYNEYRKRKAEGTKKYF